MRERADGESFEYVPAVEELDGRPGHASELLPAWRRLMEEAGLAWADIDAVAVGVGPGRSPACASAWPRRGRWP